MESALPQRADNIVLNALSVCTPAQQELARQIISEEDPSRKELLLRLAFMDPRSDEARKLRRFLYEGDDSIPNPPTRRSAHVASQGELLPQQQGQRRQDGGVAPPTVELVPSTPAPLSGPPVPTVPLIAENLPAKAPPPKVPAAAFVDLSHLRRSTPLVETAPEPAETPAPPQSHPLHHGAVWTRTGGVQPRAIDDSPVVVTAPCPEPTSDHIGDQWQAYTDLSSRFW